MFRNYLLTAWKVFMRRKLFTAINLLCIVLTLVVLMVVTALLENAFYPTGAEGRSDRYVQMLTYRSSHSEKPGWRSGTLGYKVIEHYLKPLKHAEVVSAAGLALTISVYQSDRISSVQMRQTDAEYWQILDFKLLQGRLYNKDDVAQGRLVAVINESTARRLFPGQPYLGQKFNVMGQVFSVIGVVRDELQVNAISDVWVPVTSQLSSTYKDEMFGTFSAIMMARSPAELPALQQEIIETAKRVQYDDPNRFNQTQFWGDSKLALFARTLLNSQAEDGGAPTLLSIIIVLMLAFMTLPALNLINLNMGRIMERSSEIGVRKAFGATSRQLVLQLVLENVLLCLIGGAIGLVCASGVLWWMESWSVLPYLKVHLNLAIFGYGLLIATVFGVLSGVIPAWKMSRMAPVRALKGTA